MKTILVRASRAYEVIIGKGLLDHAGELIREIKAPCKAAVFTDDKVGALYLERLNAALESAGFETAVFIFPKGEESKNPRTFFDIVDFLAKNNFHRNDLCIALGGGVVGDVTGFAAGVYMRGIDCVQIPTTLLAAIDSSVGGKTGVNLKEGKNLMGVFHQPLRVIFDTDTLQTLDKDNRLSGFGECMKYAVLEGGRLWELAESGASEENLEEIIGLCVECKKRIVEEDERETGGTRKFLNLGHTLGHAIEKLSDYHIAHGIAVVKGLALIVKACIKNKLLDFREGEKIIRMLTSYGFNLECPYTAEELASVVMMDKKADGESVEFVVVHRIGKCALLKIPANEIVEFIR
jgi:3-dehydroquinate synthase